MNTAMLYHFRALALLKVTSVKQNLLVVIFTGGLKLIKVNQDVVLEPFVLKIPIKSLFSKFYTEGKQQTL